MADKYLKMEDVHHAATAASPSPPAPDHQWAQFSTSQSSTQDAIVVHSKPAKKRKSWGQELPEPKTALPPRKRAKTDDEKEQRRIERIKRNRAAAHNSRERKRQEAENLAVHLAKANATLDAYRRHFGELPAHIQIPEVRIEVDDVGNEHITTSTPAPSLVESNGSQHDPSSPISPADDLSFPSVDVKTEIDDSTPEQYLPDDLMPFAIRNKKQPDLEPYMAAFTTAARPYEFAPLVSAEQRELQYALPGSRMLEQPFALPLDMEQDPFGAHVEDPFAFAHGATDTTISDSLFQVDEYLNFNGDTQ